MTTRTAFKFNVEGVAYTDAMGFDKERSLKAFKDTFYPVLRANGFV
jgi:hypothetical protein